MFKQINLRGISRTPSDRATADGGCAESLNVYLDGNEVAPALQPEIVCKQYGALAFEGRPVFIHKGKDYNNLILLSYSPRKLVARAKGAAMDSESQAVMTMRSGETLTDITAVGNTLIVCTSLRMEYVLYKDGEYKDLGDRIPVPQVEFRAEAVGAGVRPTMTRSYVLNKEYDVKSGATAPNAYLGYEDDKNTALELALWEEVSMGLNTIKKAKCFATPVFARAALRLSDNSYIYQTVPVLLGADITKPMFTAYAMAEKNVETGPWGAITKWMSTLYVTMQNCYRGMAYLRSFNYEGWEDIISSVDIFVSTDVEYPKFNSKIQSLKLDAATATSTKKRYDISVMGNNAEMQAESIQEELLSKSNFYRIASFAPKKFAKFTEGFNMMGDDNLVSQDYILTQKQLPDDFQSHHIKRGERVYKYNNRLMLAGPASSLSPGYPLLNGQVLSVSGADGGQRKFVYDFKFYLYGQFNNLLSVVSKNIEGGSPISPYGMEMTYNSAPVQSEGGDDPNDHDDNGGDGGSGGDNGNTTTVTVYPKSYAWLAYPDTRCRKVDIRVQEYNGDDLVSTSMRTYEMTEHPRLNCSYLYLGMGVQMGISGGEPLLQWDTRENKDYKEPNVLWASKMDNPYYWPKEGRLTFSADVLAMAAATKALSEGQIGQFPLMVFTKDGTWSIPITSEGDFGNVWPLTNDVLTSPSAVIGIEQAVIFVTNQGVMMLSGSDITPLSPHMNGEHFVPDEEMKALLSADENLAEYINAYSDKTDFVKFVSEASIAYDYSNRRLIFFRADKGYQYIYELQTATWHKLCFSKDEWISGKINSYPDCFLSTSKINTYLTKNPTNGETSLIVRMGEEVLSSNMAGNRILNVGQSQPVEILGAPITVTPGFVYDTNGTLVNGAYVEYLCTVLEAEGLPYQYYHDLYLHSSEPVDGYCDIHVVVNGTNAAGMAVKDDKVIRLNLTSDASEVVEDVHFVDALYDFSVVFDSSRQQPSSPIFHDEQKALPGLIITRPFSLDNDDIRKSINKLVIRGKKNRDDVKYLLYGSMDGLSWQRLRSLRGGSYKWFRMAILTTLSPSERISWVDIEFETRFTNRMR